MGALLGLAVFSMQLKKEIVFLKERFSEKSNLQFEIERANRKNSVDYSHLKNKIDDFDKFKTKNIERLERIEKTLEKQQGKILGLSNRKQNNEVKLEEIEIKE